MVRPVWPIWNRCGRQPASTAARDAPTAAPITLARDFEDDEVLGALEPAPAGDHDLGLGELGQAGGGLLPALHELQRGGRGGHARLLHRRAPRRAGRRPAGTRWDGAWRATASSPTSSWRGACPSRRDGSPPACRRPASARWSRRTAPRPAARPAAPSARAAACSRAPGWPWATPCPPDRPATPPRPRRDTARRRAPSSSSTRLAPHSASCLSPASVALSVSHTASAWPPALAASRPASPSTSAITFLGFPCRSSSTMLQNAPAMSAISPRFVSCRSLVTHRDR